MKRKRPCLSAGSFCISTQAAAARWQKRGKSKKSPPSKTRAIRVGSGRRIRTLTNGVRVRCATITQFRYEQMILYRYFRICQPYCRIFFMERKIFVWALPAHASRAQTAGQQSRILPSTEIVTTCHGRNFPLARSASRAACSSPPQHGTSMRTTVTLRRSLPRMICVSLSV